MSVLEIKDLHVAVDGKPIVKGLDLRVRSGEIHAIMGPNGSGKSTLASVIMGHPKYQVTKGQILFDGVDITAMPTDERAKKGLFLALQYPIEVPGVSLTNFLRTSLNAIGGEKLLSPVEFHKLMRAKLKVLRMGEEFVNRSLNEGFSGGEKKRSEILQMLLLKPKIAVLDETDSGLDIDSLKVVAKGIKSVEGENFGCLMITHYHRILKYIEPQFVHVMIDGRLVRSGDMNLALEIEEKGYDWLKEVAQ